MDWKQVDIVTVVVIIMIADRLWTWFRRIRTDHTPPCNMLADYVAESRQTTKDLTKGLTDYKDHIENQFRDFREKTGDALMEIKSSVKYLERIARNGSKHE